jgi:hypothetical protein
MGQKFEINATLTGLTRIDFDKTKIRKVMKAVGHDVRNTARKLVSRRAISQPDEYPGMQKGHLKKSIKEKVSTAGFLVTIMPRRKDFGDGDYYPAMLYYGVRRNAVRRQDHKKQTLTGPWRIAPRANFMVDAAESRREFAQNAIMQGLEDSLKPAFDLG